jgi:phosphatidylserine decarboxylase
MVITGIYYALALTVVGLALSYFMRVWAGIPFYILAVFCLYFFRDPERAIPQGRHAVSPADGKVVAVRPEAGGTRVSIFLNVFDVHVNRTPIAGEIKKVEYSPGKFLVASKEEASAANEQNTVTVEGDGATVVFKQIAGLVARRIIFYKKPGDKLSMGERVGLIQFGSRVDVHFGPEWTVIVKEGERVRAASSILARRND